MWLTRFWNRVRISTGIGKSRQHIWSFTVKTQKYNQIIQNSKNQASTSTETNTLLSKNIIPYVWRCWKKRKPNKSQMQLQRLERRRNHYIVSEETQLFVGLCMVPPNIRKYSGLVPIYGAPANIHVVANFHGDIVGGVPIWCRLWRIWCHWTWTSQWSSEWDVIAFVNYMNAKKRRRTSIEGAYFL